MGFNLAEWRANRTTTTTLPSGLEVRLRRIDVQTLAADGDVPTPLIAQAMNFYDQQLSTDATPVDDTERAAQLRDSSQLINRVVRAALVSPAVADVADDTHITIDELPFGDRMIIFNWAQGGAAALATFPSDQAGAGAPPASSGDNLPLPTE